MNLGNFAAIIIGLFPLTLTLSIGILDMEQKINGGDNGRVSAKTRIESAERAVRYWQYRALLAAYGKETPEELQTAILFGVDNISDAQVDTLAALAKQSALAKRAPAAVAAPVMDAADSFLNDIRAAEAEVIAAP